MTHLLLNLFIVATPVTVADRLLDPAPAPTPLGEVTRVAALLAIAVSIGLTVYVVDRLRKITPPEIHTTIRGYAGFVIFVALAIAVNSLALPATPGLFVTAAGAAFLLVSCVTAALQTRRRARRAVSRSYVGTSGLQTTRPDPQRKPWETWDPAPRSDHPGVVVR